MMNETVSRYEFRIFGTCLGLAEQRLRSLAPCESINESREIYLLGYATGTERNIKIRDGKLELKRLIETHQGLERWQPAGQWAFPVALDTLQPAGQWAFPVALDTLHLDNILNQAHTLPAMLSGSDLLRLVATAEVPLYRANVYKCRFRFSFPDCRAEFDQLRVNDAAIESIAIESANPQAVLQLLATLRLEDCENQSYPLAISRILGITPLPREDDYL